METKDIEITFKIIFKAKEFKIPSNINLLQSINPEIINKLNTCHRYEVQSDVPDDIFASFMDYLLYQTPQFLNNSNIEYFSQLSEEFDIMYDSVYFFKCIQAKHNYLINKKQELETNKQTNNSNYQHIIQAIFKNTNIANFNIIKPDSYKLECACEADDFQTVDDFSKINYMTDSEYLALNDSDQTATLFLFKNVENYDIPTSIKCNDKEYLITTFSRSELFLYWRLQSVTFPDNSSIHTIGIKSFEATKITSITIPSSVEKICDDAFFNCSTFQEVNFSPNSKLKSIGNNAFRNCNIKYIKIPPHVTEIGDYAFCDCQKLNEIEFSEDSEIHSLGRYIFSDSYITKVSIPSSIIELKDGWSYQAENLENIEFVQVKEKNAIYYNNEFIISKSDIKSDTYDVLIFVNRNLEKAKIPSFVKTVANDAFYNCTYLKSVEFSEDSEIQSFNDFAFYDSNINEISVPSKLMHYTSKWGTRTSKMNKIKVIPSEIKNISCIENGLIVGKTNFESDQFDILLFAPRNSGKEENIAKTIEIPSYVKIINQYAFNRCQKIEKVEFQKNSKLEIIEPNAFALSTIKEISLPSSVTILKEGAFTESSIESIFIPSHVKEIGNDCFSNCKRLKKVEFASNSELEFIGNFAFQKTQIESITIPSSVLSLGQRVFSDCDLLQKIEFQPLSNLSYFNKFLFGCCKLETLTFPSSVVEIGKNSFSFSDLKNVKFPKKCELKLIGEYSFEYSQLEEISIPSKVKIIKSKAFCSCEKLKKFEFEENSELLTIEKNAFVYSPIETLVIPSSVVNLEKGWCCRLTDVTKVIISPENKKYSNYGDYIIEPRTNSLIFAQRNICKAKIPSFVEHIAPYAFNRCEKLQTVEFEKNSKLTVIGEKAFAHSNIVRISIPPTVVKIDDFAFFECMNLTDIIIDNNSKAFLFGDYAFAFTEMHSIFVPKGCRFTDRTFYSYNPIMIIEFAEKSAFSSINDIPIDVNSNNTEDYNILVMTPAHLFK